MGLPALQYKALSEPLARRTLGSRGYQTFRYCLNSRTGVSNITEDGVQLPVPASRDTTSNLKLLLSRFISNFVHRTMQNSVTFSSAEFVAISGIMCEVQYFLDSRLSHGLGHPQGEATLVYEDNRDTILVVQNECSARGRIRHVGCEVPLCCRDSQEQGDQSEMRSQGRMRKPKIGRRTVL